MTRDRDGSLLNNCQMTMALLFGQSSGIILVPFISLTVVYELVVIFCIFRA